MVIQLYQTKSSFLSRSSDQIYLEIKNVATKTNTKRHTSCIYVCIHLCMRICINIYTYIILSSIMNDQQRCKYSEVSAFPHNTICIKTTSTSSKAQKTAVDQHLNAFPSTKGKKKCRLIIQFTKSSIPRNIQLIHLHAPCRRKITSN